MTKAKWLTPTQAVIATTRGQLLVHSFEKADNPFNQSVLYQTDNAILDVQVWRGADMKTQIFLAEDSGKVVQLDCDTLAATTVLQANEESALCISLDVILKESAVYLSVGTNSRVIVLKRELA